MLLKDKNAVIYGGGGSIGGAVARAFAREGANVLRDRQTHTQKNEKLAQAPSQAPVGDSSEKERGFRVEDGADPGPLRRALRPLASGDLLRLAPLPAHRRGEGSSTDEAGVNGALGLGVRAGRGVLDFH